MQRLSIPLSIAILAGIWVGWTYGVAHTSSLSSNASSSFIEGDSTEVAAIVEGLPDGSERIPSEDAHLEREIFEVTNEVRREHGLHALEWDTTLAHAARYHAAHMAIYGYIGHDTQLPNEEGELQPIITMVQRARAFRITSSVGENVAVRNSRTAENVVQQWMDSPGHRDNVLREEVYYLGVGHYEGRWVQKFGGR